MSAKPQSSIPLKNSRQNVSSIETITVFYTGNGYDRAVELELKRRGLKRGDVAILALPKKPKNDRQGKIKFEDFKLSATDPD